MPEPPTLLRKLGLGSATALVVANMIGTGIFTSTGFLAGDLGTSRAVLASWVVGGICALLGAICYSELALNFPQSGGEYLYLSRTYGPTWGFIAGWVSFFAGFSAPIAAAALAFAGYLAATLSQWHTPIPNLFSVFFGSQRAVAFSLVALLAAWNCFGILLSARLQNVLTATKILLLIAFTVAGLWFGDGNWRNFSIPAQRLSTTPVWQAFAISLFWIYVSYSGWNAATYVAEEIKNPKRVLPYALLIGTTCVALLYTALNVVFIYALPLDQMRGVVEIGSVAANRLFGSRIGGLFSGLIAFSLLSTVNAMTIAGPRVYYAMAKDGQFFSGAKAIHPRFRTPVRSIAAQALCTMALLLTPFAQLMMYVGFTLNFFAVMSVSTLLVQRRRPGWQKLPAVSFAYPLVPGMFIAVGTWMVIEGFLRKPGVSVATLVTLVTGAMAHHAFAVRSNNSAGPVLSASSHGSEGKPQKEEVFPDDSTHR
jgi:basic amino acid/polyamine antiporter, APA family